ncbi:MAG: bifunctional phosphopantothenoylcysteine decarboxylase/phosphopantothenate--cysteine ligase CoaBC [Thomasclavelia sp.]|nr:bifunctional phosphopantothenoylcysteine decarboxylase/phosphopantothenate--cysteine ligase CoaBC [Thomasclavelia sp.]
MKKVIIGVTGSIAAYKVCDVISKLKKKEYDIEVFMSEAAAKFISPVTIGALINKKVNVDEFEEGYESITHINLVKDADCYIIVPASANTIAKVANGIADSTLTSSFLAATCNKIIAPAMNVNMYENIVTQRNIEKCKKDGIKFVDPASGKLACGDTGRGKLADIDDIVDMIEYGLHPKPLAHKNVIVTAGPTIEKIDPVRYITNHSSGKMGYAVAKAAFRLGANVTLITGPTTLKDPYGIETVKVESAKSMETVIKELYDDADYVVMSAAVSDYRPKVMHDQKIKKQNQLINIELEQNDDILAYLGAHKTTQTLCGFAMETENVMGNAKTKFEKKNCDLLVVNDLFEEGAGFKKDTNKVTFITKNFTESKALMSKEYLGELIMDKLLKIKGE